MPVLVVLGATGRTGAELLRAAPAAGWEVVAVVRDPSRLAALDVPQPSRTVAADVRSSGGLRPALRGADAVAFCVGPVKGERGSVQADGVRACLEAMETEGVERVVATSASGGVVAGDDPLARFVAKPIMRRVLREAFADHAAMEQHLRASRARWTVVRPPQLTDRPGRGHYRSRRDGNVRWRYQLPRADLARALLDCLDDPTTVGETISLAG